MSPRPSPCDGHSGNLPAYVDHELPELEGSALEQHLERCPRCQARLRELEAVSAVLKGWDATAPAAPERLARAVLARVDAAGEARRAARSRRRLGAFALAAGVLLAVGVPLVLAQQRGAEQVPAEPFVRTVAQAPALAPAPALPAPDVPGVPGPLLKHEPWIASIETPRPGDPALAELGDPAAREAFLRGALDAQRALDMEREFERRVGQRGVWVTDVQDGQVRRMLVTAEAARAFGSDDLVAWLRSKRAETASLPRTTAPRTLALTAGDLLNESLEGLPGTPALYTLLRPGSARAPILEVRALASPASRPGAEGLEVLDPLLAQERRQLRLEPASHDVAALVAIVRDTDKPILLPAGQLVSGGETDLVVAVSTWLPATPGQQAWQVPCVVVRSGDRRGEAVARLMPFVAAPGLRALLLAGADPERVRSLVREQVAASVGGVAPAEWSLLDLYDLASDGQRVGQLAGVVDSAPAGVLVSDGGGRFLGLEHVHARGEGARPLLARLLHGYVWEAQRRVRLKGSFGTLGAPIAEAVEALRTAQLPLLEQPLPAGMATSDASRATRMEASSVVEALRVDGRRVSVSVLPR
jgi:hypothetical protein